MGQGTPQEICSMIRTYLCLVVNFKPILSIAPCNVTQLAVEQSHDHPNVSETKWKNMGTSTYIVEIHDNWWYTTTEQI